MNTFGWRLLGDIVTVILVTAIVGLGIGVLFGFDNVGWAGIFIGACIGRAGSILYYKRKAQRES